MKIKKGFLVLLTTIMLASCFDPPEFPSVPEIEFERLQFVQGPAQGQEELKLTVFFRDGDGDLGFDPGSLDYLNPPFHNSTYYQTNSSGELTPVFVYAIPAPNGTVVNFMEVLNPAQGKLAFPRTRKNPLYTSLPEYTQKSCEVYENVGGLKIFLLKSAEGVLDARTLKKDTVIANTPLVMIQQDTLYRQINPDHYNIEVDFLVYEPGSPQADSEGYVEFNFRRELQCTTYDGRFPILREDGSTALEGSLTYTMKTGVSGFSFLFSIKTLKLRVQVKDRQRNKSNLLITEPFTLDQILVGS